MNQRTQLYIHPLVRFLAVTVFGAAATGSRASGPELQKTAFSSTALRVSGGGYRLSGSLGESGIVAATIVGGSYRLRSGFWSGERAGDVTSVDPAPSETIEANALLEFRPSPFVHEVAISYRVAQPARVQLNVFDVTGTRVATLVDETQAVGVYGINWSGLDGAGQRVSAGIYFSRLDVGTWSRTAKMVRLR